MKTISYVVHLQYVLYYVRSCLKVNHFLHSITDFIQHLITKKWKERKKWKHNIYACFTPCCISGKHHHVERTCCPLPWVLRHQDIERKQQRESGLLFVWFLQCGEISWEEMEKEKNKWKGALWGKAKCQHQVAEFWATLIGSICPCNTAASS